MSLPDFQENEENQSTTDLCGASHASLMGQELQMAASVPAWRVQGSGNPDYSEDDLSCGSNRNPFIYLALTTAQYCSENLHLRSCTN